jgi:DnaJ family protein C protein 7
MQNSYDLCLSDCELSIRCDSTFLKAFQRGIKAAIALGQIQQGKSLLAQASSSSLSSLQSEQKELDSIEFRFDQLSQLLKSASGNFVQQAEQLCKLCPASIKAKIFKAEALIYAKRFEEAKELCNSLFSSGANQNLELLRVRGLALLYTGQSEMANKHFQMILQQDPDNSRAASLFKLTKRLEAKKTEGNNAFQAGKSQEAYDLYSEALSIDPLNDAFNATLYCNRAAAAMKLNKYQQAIEDCSKTLAIKDDFVKAYLRRSQCYQQLEQWEEVVRDLESAAKLEPNSGDIQRQLKDAKLELKKSKRKDYYKILEIPKDADAETIRKAYRKAALRWHPDKNSETEEKKTMAEAKFKDITEAHEVLSDDQKRRRYDSGVDLEDDGMPGGFRGGGGGMGGMDMNDLFSMFMQGGMGGMGGARRGGHSHGHGHGGMPRGFHF